MKKCPTCEKTFDDNMRFCQVDGTPLVDDAPPAAAEEEAPFDPYATIVGVPKTAIPPSAPPEASVEPPAASPVGEVMLEPVAPAAEETPSSSADALGGDRAGSIPVAPPDEILDLGNDPLKTMYVSDAEMKEVMGTAADGADTPAEEMKADETLIQAAPPTDFGSMSPPPSPFSEPSAPEEAPVPEPASFLEPEKPSFDAAETQFQQAEPSFQEAPTMYQSEPQFAPPPAPMQQQEWAPPPAPTPEWQGQPIGSNTPFQPPPVGAGGENKTLAIISLVLGIVSICCYVGPLTGLGALITGFLAYKKASSDPQNFGGKGLAITGMITGGLFMITGVVYYILIILGVALGGLK